MICPTSFSLCTWGVRRRGVTPVRPLGDGLSPVEEEEKERFGIAGGRRKRERERERVNYAPPPGRA